ncbi:MAG: hypothetical protein WDZ46_02205 [Solirubrobacterales bacterium]
MIAAERDDGKVAAMIEEAHDLGGHTVVPASVLAQVWRGGPKSARVARLIDGSVVDVLDEDRAKEVGRRLGKRERADIADAHVVCCAVERLAAILTSDLGDAEALMEPGESVGLVGV